MHYCHKQKLVHEFGSKKSHRDQKGSRKVPLRQQDEQAKLRNGDALRRLVVKKEGSRTA